MYKLLEYLKYLGLFLIFILIITLLTSLINLTNINTVLISKISIILTAISFFIISTKASSKIKGYILVLKLGLLFVIFLLLINIIFFKSAFNIDRIIYYIILIASSILGGSFGKNFHFKKTK